jgi:hypothetical protein
MFTVVRHSIHPSTAFEIPSAPRLAAVAFDFAFVAAGFTPASL